MDDSGEMSFSDDSDLGLQQSPSPTLSLRSRRISRGRRENWLEERTATASDMLHSLYLSSDPAAGATPRFNSNGPSVHTMRIMDSSLEQRLDSPRRTDYTYSYSESYRLKNPSPKIENPLLSRPGLRKRAVAFPTALRKLGTTTDVKPLYFKEGLNTFAKLPAFMYRSTIGFFLAIVTSIFGFPKDVDKSRLTTSDSGALAAAERVGYCNVGLDGAGEVNNYKSASATNGRINVGHCSSDFDYETHYSETHHTEEVVDVAGVERMRHARSSLCSFCWWLIPLLACLMLVLCAYLRPKECRQILTQYAYTLPLTLVNRTRDFVTTRIVYLPWSGREAEKHVSTTETVYMSNDKKIMHLEDLIAGLQQQVAAMKSCCKEPDLSAFLRLQDLSALVASSPHMSNVVTRLSALESALKDLQVAQVTRSEESSTLITATTMKNYQAELGALSASINALSTRLDSVLEEAGINRSDSIQKIAELMMQNDHARAQIEDLRLKMEQLSALESALKDLQLAQVTRSEESSTSIMMQNDHARAQIEDLRFKMEQLSTAQTAAATTLQAQIEELRLKMEQLPIAKIAAATTLQAQIEELRLKMEQLHIAQTAAASTCATCSEGMSVERVQGVIAAALAVYDMDKTGLVDHALEPAGATVLSIRCSETYAPRTRRESFWGIPFWYESYSPRTVIQPGVTPGECWAFKGDKGFLVVQLTGWIEISQFSYEHIPKAISPDGHIESAPRKMEVFGLLSEQDPNPTLLAQFEYDENGAPLQFFPVTERKAAVPIIELKVLSNHGHPVYTCMYRFRVHGKRIKPAYGQEP